MSVEDEVEMQQKQVIITALLQLHKEKQHFNRIDKSGNIVWLYGHTVLVANKY